MSKPYASNTVVVFLSAIILALLAWHIYSINQKLASLEDDNREIQKAILDLSEHFDIPEVCEIEIDDDMTSFSGSDFELIDNATAYGLVTEFAGPTKAINLYSSLICGLYNDITTRPGGSDVPAYRIYYGQSSSFEDNLFGVIVPLDLDAAGNLSAQFDPDSKYMSIKVPNHISGIGPCPMNCYFNGPGTEAFDPD